MQKEKLMKMTEIKDKYSKDDYADPDESLLLELD